jgi:hypothetical protein
MPVFRAIDWSVKVVWKLEWDVATSKKREWGKPAVPAVMKTVWRSGTTGVM